MVEKARRYIVDGDNIQVVLAQHFSTDIDADAFDIYRALRYINPSPYMYFLQLDDERAIAGSSPEVMVRVTDNHAAVRPIAGTRPRGSDDAEDQALAVELLADPKEIAEHVMLVDLARNDLGRIAPVGSVTVREYMVVEKYSHVMHIVSHVDSEVLPGYDAIDVFKATFPAGTLSGAPKVRAMEIINEPAARMAAPSDIFRMAATSWTWRSPSAPSSNTGPRQPSPPAPASFTTVCRRTNITKPCTRAAACAAPWNWRPAGSISTRTRVIHDCHDRQLRLVYFQSCPGNG